MAKSKNSGCFAWCITFKMAANERVAKFRNNLRRKLFRDNKHQVPMDASALENETGSPEMDITRRPVPDSSIAKPVSESPISKTVPKKPTVKFLVDSDDEVIMESVKRSIVKVDEQELKEKVREYVQGIIANAVRIVQQDVGSAEHENHDVTLCNDVTKKKVISFREDNERDIVDDVSISSSIISELAETAVIRSLTNFVAAGDANQSATGNRAPRTVREMKELLEIIDADDRTANPLPVVD